MKGIYLSFFPINYDKATGVEKKIVAQVNSFNKVGLDCVLITSKERGGIWGAILRRLPFIDAFYKWDEEVYENLDYIYVRKPSWFTFKIIKLFKNIKRINPQIKIVMEFPTYPYDKEFSRKLKDIPFLIKEKVYCKHLVGIVDRIATYSDDDYIFGVQTIRIVNGIDLDSVKPRQPLALVDDAINICAVAKVSKWHGYDRFIKGLAKYYNSGGERNIVLHIVGDGDEVNDLKKIVLDNDIAENVLFYGFKSGEELDGIYNISDLALEVLGAHRKDIYISSSLKSREYLAKGLPIITESVIDILHQTDFPYLLKIPSDESSVEIRNVVNFFDRVYCEEITRASVVKKIRNYATKTCDINATMLPVFNYLIS